MAQIRKDSKFGRRYMLGNLFYFIPGVIAFYFIWKNVREFNLTCIASIGVFLSCIIVGIWMDIFRFRTYRCPECNHRIPKRQIDDNRKIYYYCSNCDIQWDTTLSIPDD